MAEQKEESVSFTISYWAISGRGAALRAAAFLGGISYKDEFVSGVYSSFHYALQANWLFHDGVILTND